jgi:hypothetical protein
MDKEFVSYEIALALKELGFDEECFKWYHNPDLLTDDEVFLIYNNDNELFAFAPLKQQVFRWFQNKYKWYHTMDFCRKAYPSTNQYKWKIDIGLGDVFFIGWADTYEEAEDEGIKKLIELAKEKDK